ncbi:hypothetical protein QPK31_20440 [Massilia sp. YIM B02769]|uniref:hypothetical protein n=1 Tax=unclassified Massilia TaxID=2609279 RepID=UPI0025B6D2AD|nr:MULTISPECIES: hypothetical protein [unclassified Massilia]MDN4060584.1 hypothetical protein [Massilia sp. YIM B02769]
MNKHLIAAVLALPLALSSAFAQEAEGPTVKIRGFGTGALTWTDTNDAEFARPNQAAGAKKSPRTGVDSNLGLQADIGINSWLSFTGQGLVRHDADDNYGAELAWAFAKAKINDQFSVRVGRIGLPAFMISDYRNVGYANTFLRPPVEMYSQVPFNSVDGIDATYQHSFGDTTVTGQLAYGRTSADVAVGLRAKGKDITALNLVAEHGPFTARIGRVDAKITITGSSSLNALIGGLRMAGAGYNLPQLTTMGNELDATDKKASFTSVGLGMDWNNIVAQSEFAKRKTDSYVNDTTSWYLMGGYRIGKVLPYVIHGKLSIDGHPANVIPAGVPALAALRAGASGLPYYGIGQGEQSTTSVGVRWDFHSSMALKAQIDRVQPKIGNGLLINAKPGFHDDVTVGAVALDFVF